MPKRKRQTQKDVLFGWPIATDEIRVLELIEIHDLADAEAGFQCLLHTIPFSAEPWTYRTRNRSMKYIALSYVCREVSGHIKITCNDKALQVTKNLGRALHAIWIDEPHLMIWADALCINQKDGREKSNQVSMLSSIFERATDVHIWLGNHYRSKNTLSSFSSLLEDLQGPDDDLAYEHMRHLRKHTDLVHRILKHAEILSDQAWYTRSWTVQEYILSRNPWIRHGEDKIGSDSFSFYLRWCHQAALSLEQDLENSSLIDQLLTASNQFETRLLKRGLSYLLQRYRHCQASDVRDKIFSLLGAATDPAHVLIQPDYSATVRDIAVLATKAAIYTEQTLDALMVAIAARLNSINKIDSQLPTWVIDPRLLQDSRDVSLMGRVADDGFLPELKTRLALSMSEAQSLKKELSLVGTAIGRMVGQSSQDPNHMSSTEWKKTWKIAKFPPCVLGNNIRKGPSLRLSREDGTLAEQGLEGFSHFLRMTICHDEGLCFCLKEDCAVRVPFPRHGEAVKVFDLNLDWIVLLDGSPSFFTVRMVKPAGESQPNTGTTPITFQLVGEIPLDWDTQVLEVCGLDDEIRLTLPESMSEIAGSNPANELIPLLPDHIRYNYPGKDTETRTKLVEHIIKMRMGIDFWSQFPCVRGTFTLV